MRCVRVDLPRDAQGRRELPGVGEAALQESNAFMGMRSWTGEGRWPYWCPVLPKANRGLHPGSGAARLQVSSIGNIGRRGRCHLHLTRL